MICINTVQIMSLSPAKKKKTNSLPHLELPQFMELGTLSQIDKSATETL